jgi:hypothetical protein
VAIAASASHAEFTSTISSHVSPTNLRIGRTSATNSSIDAPACSLNARNPCATQRSTAGRGSDARPTLA